MSATLNPNTVQMQKNLTALLSKAVIRRAHLISLTKLNEQIAFQFEFDSYVIKILEAPIEIRDQVRAALAEDLRAGGEAAINQSLGGAIIQILTGFEIMPVEAQNLFVVAYMTAATVATQGSDMAVRPYIVQPGHIPPINTP